VFRGSHGLFDLILAAPLNTEEDPARAQ